VAKDHFVVALREQYEALAPSDRKKKIRELVAESKDNEKFIRQQFPEFFAEAFTASNRSKNRAGRRSVSSARSGLAAKRR